MARIVPLLEDGAIISLASGEGDRGLCTEESSAGPSLRCNAHHDMAWEQLRVQHTGSNKVAFAFVRRAEPCYLSARPDGVVLAFKRNEPLEWEEFTLMPFTGGRIGLRTHHGRFVGADRDTGALRCDYPGNAPEAAFVLRKQGENGQFQTISLPYLQEGTTITISPSIDRSVRLGVASSSADIIPLACAASSDKAQQEFGVQIRGDGTVALWLANPLTIYLTPHADGRVLHSPDTQTSTQEFSIVPLAGGKVALRASHGGFLGVSAEKGWEVRCDFRAIGPQTTFIPRQQGPNADTFEPVSAKDLTDGAMITLALASSDARIGRDCWHPPLGVRCTEACDQTYEQYRVHKRTNNKIALSVPHAPRQYISAQPNGTMQTNRNDFSECEGLTVIPLGGSRVALKTHHGGYIGVRPDTLEVRCDFASVVPETTFVLHKKAKDGSFLPIDGYPSPSALATPPAPATPPLPSTHTHNTHTHNTHDTNNATENNNSSQNDGVSANGPPVPLVPYPAPPQPPLPAAPTTQAPQPPQPLYPPIAPSALTHGDSDDTALQTWEFVSVPTDFAPSCVYGAQTAASPGPALQPGVLIVCVEFAQGLKNTEWIGRQDPYVVLTVGNSTYRTRTLKTGGTSPVFNETFKFNVINENGLELLVKNEGIMRDDVLGRAHCDLASVRLTGCDRQKVPVLCHKSSKQYGFVSVGLQFTPNSV